MEDNSSFEHDSNSSDIIISEGSTEENDNNNAEENETLNTILNEIGKICPEFINGDVDSNVFNGGEEVVKSICEMLGTSTQEALEQYHNMAELITTNGIRAGITQIVKEVKQEPLNVDNIRVRETTSIKNLEEDWQNRFINAVCDGSINGLHLNRIRCIYCSLSSLEKAAFLNSNIEEINSFISLQRDINFTQDINNLENIISKKDEYISELELRNDELQDAVNELTIELVNCRRNI